MRVPLVLSALRGMLLVLGAVAAGCATLSPDKLSLPPRNEAVSFFGPGRSRVDRKLLEPIYFAPGSWQIPAEEKPKLDRAAAVLGQERRALLGGFDDNIAPEEHSRVLSEARAQTVREALIARGVPPTHLQTVGFGQAHPAGNDPALNRRVEIGVLK